MRRVLFLLACAIFVPFASAEVIYTENFEADPIGPATDGVVPDASWYDYLNTSGGGCNNEVASISGSSPISGSRHYQMAHTDSGCSFKFTLTPNLAYSYFEFRVRRAASGSGFYDLPIISSSAGQIARITLATGTLCLSTAGSTTCSGQTTIATGQTGTLNYHFQVELDYAADLIFVTETGLGVTVSRSIGASHADFLSLQFVDSSGSGGATRIVAVDDLVFKVNPDDEEVPPVPEAEGPLVGDNGALFGGDKAALASGLQISVPALEALVGILLIMVFAAAGVAAYKLPGGLAGAGVGYVFVLGFGLLPFWSIIFVLLSVGAVWFVRQRNG